MSPPTVSEIKPLPPSESSIVKEQERVQYVRRPFLGDGARAVDEMTVARDSLKTTKDSTEVNLEKISLLTRKSAPSYSDVLVQEERKTQPEIHSLQCNASAQEPQNKLKYENAICIDTTKAVASIATTEHIVHPEPNDVLFGRGKPYQGHSGNQKLREIVDKYKDAYMSSRRYDKLAIAEDIVKGIQGGRWGEAGRFLRRADNGEDFWVVAPDDEAREKVSHALRGKKKMCAGTLQGPYSSEKKERKVDTGNSVEDYLHAARKHQQLNVLRTAHDPIAGEYNLSASTIRLSERGSNLGIANDHQRMLLLAENMENSVRPGGAAGGGIIPPLELQSLFLASRHPNQHQQLLQQQILNRDTMPSSLFGREERNVVQDVSSLIANSNRFLAAQLGLLRDDHRLPAPSSALPHYQQAVLSHQPLNPLADIFGRGQASVGDAGRVTSDVSPLISALLGQRVTSDGTRGPQHVAQQGGTVNVADVMRDLQQARDQRTLAELILRSRGHSGAFGDDTNHQS